MRWLLFLLLLLLASSHAASSSLLSSSQLTLDEKCNLLTGTSNLRGFTGYVNGVKRLGIPGLAMNDGPQGFRGPKGTSTCWPCGLALAATFNPQLVFRVAQATGKEFTAKGASVFLGPGMNLARVPTCGRNFEYLCGEDALLGELMATQYIRGIQSNPGLMATAKHFVNNEQETERNFINSVVDDFTNWNLYYRPFLASVARARVAAVMCSYNLVNGAYACENPKVLRGHLKHEMKFTGVVMSDWFATKSTLASATAGMDLEMPIPLYFGSPVRNLVQQGELDERVVDDKVERILRAMQHTRVRNETQLNVKFNATSQEHNALARLAAASSAVLLRNEAGLLPLRLPTKTKHKSSRGIRRIVLLGDGASGKVLFTGGGSGHVSPAHVVSPREAISNYVELHRRRFGLPQPTFQVDYYSTSHALELKVPFAPTDEDEDGGEVQVLVFVGASSTETKDRATLGLGARQNALVLHATNVLSPTRGVVVCVTAPGAVLLEPFFNRTGAIVLQFLAGQATGDGLADLLFGRVDPGGARLPVTLPRVDNEVGMTQSQFPGTRSQANYSEGLLIGYRYYSRHSDVVRPLLPFGFGQSYATFRFLGAAWEVLPVRRELVVKVGLLSALIRGSGSTSTTFHKKPKGVAVVQVYVTKYPKEAGGASELPTALVGFARMELSRGEIGTAEVKISLSVEHDSLSPLAVWRQGKYHVYPGVYTLAVGDSSANFWRHEKVLLVL